jgi:lysophospholipase L1-like esterase
MRKKLFLPLVLLCLSTAIAPARDFEAKPSDPALAPFDPVRAPVNRGLILKKGDRLAICGDSITEQRMYSRIMEDYLTMCVPQLQVTVRQYGWSGERAPGFLGRMTNDCLRFKPTVATTCYGMNDHEYRPYEERIGQTYAKNSQAIIDGFKAAGARVIQGSPGCVGKMPSWVKSAAGSVQDLNLNLCNLRNIGIEVALKEKVRFADIFWPMMTAGVEAQKRFGPDFAIAGKDGVHPGWAGQTLMAYAFLKAMGLDGEVGTLKVDLKKGKMKASTGHEVISSNDGSFQIRSSRYPFCACENGSNAAERYPVCDKDDVTKDSSIRAAMQLIPFNRELNRFVLTARRGSAASYRVRWGNQEAVFSADQLAQGINLAEVFPANPFSDAFARVDAAVAAKQAFETKQIKDVFHGKQGKENMEEAVSRTEAERAPLANAIQAAMVPVLHTIRIEPL